MSPENRDRLLLRALSQVLSEFQPESSKEQFMKLLDTALTLTDSEYGFVGEVRHMPDGKPFLKTFAITDISWSKETSDFFEQNEASGLEFTNLDTLFGRVMTTGEQVIANDPYNDPRRGGLPPGHPKLNAFLGLPIEASGELVGMLGIANRPGGYDKSIVTYLQPFLMTCGSFIRLIRAQNEKHEIERELKQSEAMARSVLDTSLDAVIITDEKGKVISVNPSTQKLFGYAPEELIGRNVRVLVPEPHRSRHDSYMRRYLETGEARVIGSGRETMAVRKDGSRFPISLSLAELNVPEGQRFTGIVRDISDRKIAEAKLEESIDQLRESNENMLSILNQTRLGILMTDAEGQVVFVSEFCEDLLRCKSTDLVGQPWERVCPLSKSDKRLVEKLFMVSPNERVRHTVNVKPDDNREYWLEVDVRDDPRDPLMKIIIMEDVSELHKLRNRINQDSKRQIVGESAAMQEIFEQVERYASGDWPVLIEGETGVGKELVARAVHATSERQVGPFIAVNCAGLTTSVLTSQLFGHKRGAFTDAVADHEGLFEAASGGTIFLDEIGELPLNFQAALLRVLQEKEVTRVGESQPRKVDVRIISATNRNLEREVERGDFREDMYYRICVAKITVPPLRNRRSDIPLLVRRFLQELDPGSRGVVKSVHPNTMNLLRNYVWPGNVRELKSVVETSVINVKGSELNVEHLPFEIREGSSVVPDDSRPSTVQTGDLRERLVEALERAGGNRSRAAKLLGISRATLYRHMSEVGIEPKRASRK